MSEFAPGRMARPDSRGHGGDVPLKTLNISIFPSEPNLWMELDNHPIKVVEAQSTRLIFMGGEGPFDGIHDLRLEIKIPGATSGEPALYVLTPTERLLGGVTFDITGPQLNLPYQGVEMVVLAQDEEGDDFAPYAWRHVPLMRDGHHSGPPGALPLPRLVRNTDGGAAVIWTDNASVVQSVQLNGLAEMMASLWGAVSEATDIINSGAARLNLPGFVQEYYGTTLPAGWLWCDGSAVSRATYSPLFAALGTTYGDGDGSTTFNLPDKRGRTAIGRDDMGGAGAGRILVSLNGNITSGSPSITSLSSTSSLTVNMKVFGAGIPAGATISSIDSGTAITISAHAEATTVAVPLTFSLLSGTGLGATGGRHVQNLSEGQLPSHRHFVAATGDGTATLNNSNQVSQQRTNMGDGGDFNLAGIATDATLGRTSATGGNQAHPNLPPVIVCNFIIKT